MIGEKTTGLMLIVLAIVLIILYGLFPNLVDWLYALIVALLFIYGIYLFLTKD
jgi:hypothetical protein